MPQTATDQIKLPEDCETMTEVRAGVDALDQALVRLLARRFGYMDAAARIKPNRDAVRDAARKAAVLTNIAALSDELGLPTDRLVAVWDVLVENSIDYELGRWDATRG